MMKQLPINLIGTKIILSTLEQEVVKLLVSCIIDNKIASGKEANVTKICNDSTLNISIQGYAAEFAFCKLFNLMPDFGVDNRSCFNNDDFGDVILNGLKVDIKNTKYITGKLINALYKKKNEHVDLLTLMIGESPEFIFKGFIKVDEFYLDSNIINLGYGPTYAVEQNKLKELHQL